MISNERAIQIIKDTLEYLEDDSYSVAEMREKCNKIGLSANELKLLGYDYLVEEN